MHRTIDSMPAHARVWVYKSAKAITPEQRAIILGRGVAFTAAWAAHGTALDACVDVLHDHFVVIAVDEQQAMASGCSIDKSVRLVQDLERELGLNLTDRMVVLFKEGDALRSCRVQDVEQMLRMGEMTRDTVVYDDVVGTVGEMRDRFPTALANTWLVRWL